MTYGEPREREVEYRLMNFQTFSPKQGWGKLAEFDVLFGEYITVRKLIFHVAEDGFYKIITPRIAKVDAFTVEMPRWLCRRIASSAADALRAIGHNIPDRSPRGSFLTANHDDRRKPEPEPVEDDAAGLRRVIGETLARAGL